MLIKFYEHNSPTERFVSNYPGWYYCATLLIVIIVAGVAGAVIWSALRPTESRVETQDPRVAELVRTDPEPSELQEASVNGLASSDADVREATLQQLVPPIKGNYVLSAGFGPRTHPKTGRPDEHKGYDYAAYKGTPVVAVAGGLIARVFRNPFYGIAVEVDHGGDVSTLYAHLCAARVEKDINVRRGDIIGYVGSTGRTTGPHLHLEVRVNGRPVRVGEAPFSQKYHESIAQQNTSSGDDGDKANCASNSSEVAQIESPDATEIEKQAVESSSLDDSYFVAFIQHEYEYKGETKMRAFDCMGDGKVDIKIVKDFVPIVANEKGVTTEELAKQLNSECKRIVEKRKEMMVTE